GPPPGVGPDPRLRHLLPELREAIQIFLSNPDVQELQPEVKEIPPPPRDSGGVDWIEVVFTHPLMPFYQFFYRISRHHATWMYTREEMEAEFNNPRWSTTLMPSDMIACTAKELSATVFDDLTRLPHWLEFQHALRLKRALAHGSPPEEMAAV